MANIGKSKTFLSCDRILGSQEALPLKKHKLLDCDRKGFLALVCDKNIFFKKKS